MIRRGLVGVEGLCLEGVGSGEYVHRLGRGPDRGVW